MENNSATEDELKVKIQELLRKAITKFVLKGKGYCNNAYYIETSDKSKYIVKEQGNDKELQEQNDLAIEAVVIQQLYKIGLSVPIPRVIFVSEKPKMYGYEYIEGDMMMDVWESLSETERIDICRTLGYFHSEIGKKFTKEMAKQIGIKIDESLDVHPEVVLIFWGGCIFRTTGLLEQSPKKECLEISKTKQGSPRRCNITLGF